MIYRLASTHLVALIEEALGFAGHLVHDTPITTNGPHPRRHR
ncbi:hypothetical protein JOF36_007232 [Pseudonocardia parietis]|uniref:Uncharacterized protein n=1 Tax=Pseudonocardia parietis TaxID=570936 RepID=A0ABS4W5I1_9PSEU|nr:hypothetical protein [Pseudonocardia parietis]